jgi:hypothetical protein
LADLGISHDQSSRAQKLAAVPDADFEQAVKAPGRRASTTGIIAAAAAPPKINAVGDDALWLWGRRKDLEPVLALDPNYLLTTMLPHMVETTKPMRRSLRHGWKG